MHTHRAWLLFITFSSCGGELVAQGARAMKPARPDESIFSVRGPTLITSFVATQADMDSSAQTNEALSDYQYYLSRAVRVLERHGVKVYATNDSTVHWRDSRGLHRISAADGGGVVYLFVLPNGRKTALRGGVEVDDAILEAARKRFHLEIPESQPDSDSRQGLRLPRSVQIQL